MTHVSCFADAAEAPAKKKQRVRKVYTPGFRTANYTFLCVLFKVCKAACATWKGPWPLSTERVRVALVLHMCALYTACGLQLQRVSKSYTP